MKENCVRVQEQAQAQAQLSGYQLTHLILRGKKADLTSTEVLIFSTLATYWNGKPIYPRIKTLCENTLLSEKAVRNNINSLISKGYLIKTKGRKNSNLYNINVNKVLSTIESGTNNRTSAVPDTVPIYMKSDNKKLNHHHEKSGQKVVNPDDDFSSKRHIALDEVPEHIRNNPKVKNPCGYWASLSENEKKEQLEKAQEIERKKLVSLERKRKLKELKAREEEEKRIYNEQCVPPTKEFLELGKRLRASRGL